MSTWTYALLVLGLGILLGLLFFLTGMSRGLGPAKRRVVRVRRTKRPAGSPSPATERTQQVRGLLVVMGISLLGGLMLGRPAMLLLAVLCLGLAYLLSRN